MARRTSERGITIGHVKASDGYAGQILESAIDAIRYWAEVVEVLRGDGGGVYEVTITDLEHDGGRRKRKVTIGQIKRAIGLVLREGDGIGAGGEIRRQVLTEDPDGPRCDAVFQVALFGEVRYS